ncbi:MAG: hypothetical protein IKD66_12595 [Solobacterium sp.]|nr:hypothetical protein [Solobacterium sp.]
MKDWKECMLESALTLGLVFSLAGCGSSASAPSQASAAPDNGTAAAETVKEFAADGKYTSLGMQVKDYIVTDDSATGLKIELNKDGTGSLDFGGGNAGPVSSWSESNGNFSMQAGVSDFTGTLKNGILDLDFGDGLVIVFAQDGASYDKSKVISVDEYEKIAKEAAGAATTTYGGDPAAAGEYSIYALESNGKCIKLPPEEQMVFIFTLKEDGSGTVTVDDEAESLHWKVDGKKLSLFEQDGTPTSTEYDMSIEKGILKLVVPADGESPEVIEYFVTKDADVTSLNAVDADTLN